MGQTSGNEFLGCKKSNTGFEGSYYATKFIH